MNLTEITADSLIQFFIGGCGFLEINKDDINALNVFPVPDGDTGTNMSLTMNSATKDLNGLSTTNQVAQVVARGALMGARGNSGVILSQLFRGFAQGVGEKKILKGTDLAFALQKGVELAYKSVMKPVEGTILTVSKAVATGAVKQSQQSDDIIEILTYGVEQGHLALDNTPNQLPALKEAGVVDAGGKGFLLIIEGGLKALQGETWEVRQRMPEKEAQEKPSLDHKEIPFQYCTEFLLTGKNLSVEDIKHHFQNQGDSLLVVGSDDLIKVHIHTNHPGTILEYALQRGALHDIKIDNMQEQHRETIMEKSSMTEPAAETEETDIPESPCGVVAVTTGVGLAQIFKSLGVHTVINGGQTMNPSAEDLLTAIQGVNAREVVVLPNNSNIILAAQQAQSLSEKKVTVIPTKSIVQGLAAMLAFDPEQNAAHNQKSMSDAFSHVQSGAVTYAVRNSSFNGFDIKENDLLGLVDDDIQIIGQELDQVVLDLLQKMVQPDHELITLYYGEQVTEEQASQLQEKIAQRWPEKEIELHFGGQPLYYYFISVE
ncbi:DAK2 domain-containing protein [Dehalobacterium formicoaceticum]|uniref:DAK2 domain-containing protein n=1 Tax=Dehalobacterium formicoaceticum TaxID=51515 RepID=A0ABT1Y6X6_9FIRM|nr:DAK2 domain-containing protein [Dehalobacterium formicoaceticum]MCR6546308.1 DAK2 domain-containing protein [Dehalobacterium formicoaceticum]